VAWRVGAFDGRDRLTTTGAGSDALLGKPAAPTPSASATPPSSTSAAGGDPAITGITNTTAPGSEKIDPMTGLPAKAAPPAAGGAVAPHPARGTTARTGGGTATARPVPLAAAVSPELLLTRATYGATPALRAEIKKVGPAAWLGRQLAPASVPDPEGDAVVAMYPTLNRTPQSLYAEFEGTKDSPTDPSRDLQAAHISRAIWSRRQLFEVMVGFWSDHFTVPVTVDNGRLTRADYDRTVIRAHALGRFEDLLVAVAHHPAMLTYLNLAGSSGSNPNENFARELMELHTVGIDGGYTEADIKQAAKLLTGLVLKPDMTVTFEPGRHYVGAVKVMTFTHANATAAGGPTATRAFYTYLARHPSTARFLATKLARHFVQDTPPASLVASLAKVYLANDTAIGPVLRALFASKEFAASGGLKLRRPMEHLAAVARAAGLGPGTDPKTMRDFMWWLGGPGHIPFAWTTPDGYPDVAAAWQSAGQALAQFNIASALVHGWGPKGFVYPKPAALLSDAAHATTPAAVTAQVAMRLFGRAPTRAEAAAAATLLSAQEEATALVTVLLAHSPAFLTR